jgi:hypothetical protein
MEFKAPSSNEGGKKATGLDERIGSLFQPDTLIGEDYASNFRRKIPLEAERTLLLAILEDGIRSFQENLFATSGKRRTIFDEANEWIFSDDDSWFCSFVSICNLLSLEPQYIRRGLHQWEARMNKSAAQKKPLSTTGDEQRLVA